MSRRAWYARVIALSTLVAIAIPVSAQANLAIASAPSVIALQNNPFLGARAPMDVVVSHTGDATDWFVTVSAGSFGDFSQRRARYRISFFFFTFDFFLNYNVYTSASQIAEDLSVPITPNTVESGSFVASVDPQQAVADLEVRMRYNQFEREGLYSDTVTVSLYEGSPLDPNSAVLVEQRQIQITIQTIDVGEIGIVPVGNTVTSATSSYTMDFGPLEQGESQQVDLVYRANAGFDLYVTSANGGVLSNINGPVGTIPYIFRAGGTTYNLSSRQRIDGQFLTGTGEDYYRRTVEVEIGALSNPPPGLYTDILTFEVDVR